MMKREAVCPSCGADWSDGQTCQDHFYTMGFWEMENPAFIPDAHHLMVLSYHLQHPELYSPEGLAGAIRMLDAFLMEGVSTQTMRREIRDAVDSGKRKHPITAKGDRFGRYSQPVRWTMWAGDVTAAGMDSYVASVKVWAGSIHAALREAGAITTR